MTILNKIKDRRSYKDTPSKNITLVNHNASKSDGLINSSEMEAYTIRNIKYMYTYALQKGKTIPENASTLLHSNNFNDVLKFHSELCKIIAPASPETIAYLNRCNLDQRKRIILSPIPLVRYFIIIAIIAIIALISSGLSADVNTETLSKGILNNHGLSLFKNLLFLCSASLIGVVFFLLSKLTNAVKQATLSKDDSTYYWAMLIMGMLSGLIMSEVIVLNQESLEDQSVEMNRLLFALLGGFSSEVVYGILQSVMDKIGKLLGGN